jgi:copper(I)-binding protein
LLPAGLPSAGYVTLRNDSNVGKRLESVSSDAFGSVMLHESMRSSGMQHMRMVDAIDIPAHGQVALAPGGYHLMLMQPRQPLKVGAKVVMVLHFADGAAVSATFNVHPANASGDQP